MKNKFISFKDILPKVYEIVPGLIKSTYYSVTGQTGTAKTKFAKFLFVLESYKYCKKHNIPLKIIYFALEESAEVFWISIRCDLLYKKYGETVTFYQYENYHPGMTPLIKEHLDSFDEEIAEMKTFIEVIDYISNPTGMYKKVRDVMNTLGTKIDGVEDSDENGNKWKSFEFKYHNSDTHVIVVADHISLISGEKNPITDCSTTHLAMSKWSEYVVRYICKKYQCIVCNVHQQQMAGDNEMNAQNNPEMLLPSRSKFADNLLIVRDYQLIFGLFNPVLYKAFAKNYKGYNMESLKDNFRQLLLIKHRSGKDNKQFSLQFNGEINYFKELPLIEEREKLVELYKTINK